MRYDNKIQHLVGENGTHPVANILSPKIKEIFRDYPLDYANTITYSSWFWLIV
jgi:hypothetical protein